MAKWAGRIQSDSSLYAVAQACATAHAASYFVSRRRIHLLKKIIRILVAFLDELRLEAVSFE